MKKSILLLLGLLFATSILAQEEKRDTTKVNLGSVEVLIVELEEEETDTTTLEEPKDKRRNEAHWAGVSFGFNVLSTPAMNTNFTEDPFLKNDIARSQVWEFNVLEHKFKIVKEYVGLTTGLGFTFTQVGLRNNYVLGANGDSTFAVVDTLNNYRKNKLRAAYITVPLLLEFNTNKNNDKGMYLAAGVVGGYRIASRYKQVYEVQGDRVKTVKKGGYNLNPFILNLTARLGYGDFGVFANYNMLPLFETGATETANSFNAGLTFNF